MRGERGMRWGCGKMRDIGVSGGREDTGGKREEVKTTSPTMNVIGTDLNI